MAVTPLFEETQNDRLRLIEEALLDKIALEGYLPMSTRDLIRILTCPSVIEYTRAYLDERTKEIR